METLSKRPPGYLDRCTRWPEAGLSRKLNHIFRTRRPTSESSHKGRPAFSGGERKACAAKVAPAFCVGARAAAESTAMVAARPPWWLRTAKTGGAALLRRAAAQRSGHNAADPPSPRENRRGVCSSSSVASSFITAMRTFPSQVLIMSIGDKSSFGAASFVQPSLRKSRHGTF